MHITVSKSSIVQAVQRCQSVVEKRNTVPVLSNILLKAMDDTLVITATDLEVGMRTRIPATVHTSGTTTVSARKLFDIVKELDAEAEVDIEVDAGFLNIKSGRAKFRLSTLDAEDFPDLKVDEDGITVHIPGHELAEMIASTSFAMSQAAVGQRSAHRPQCTQTSSSFTMRRPVCGSGPATKSGSASVDTSPSRWRSSVPVTKRPWTREPSTAGSPTRSHTRPMLWSASRMTGVPW